MGLGDKEMKYTLQESCDYAVKQMVSQGGRCVNEEGGCVYDNGEGKHCAVGHIMKLWGEPEDSKAWCYYSNVGGLTRSGAVKDKRLLGFLSENRVAISQLQIFHDSFHSLHRREYLENLSEYVDTSGEHWQQWLEMGR